MSRRRPPLLRLVGLFWSTSVAAEMEYRTDFALAVLNSGFGLLTTLFGLSLVFGDGPSFAGWTWHQAMAVVGVFTILEGFTRAVLEPNLGQIVRHVQQGTLDFVLLKPVSAQLWLSTRGLSPWGFPDVALGVGLTVWAALRAGAGAADLALALVPLAAAVVTLYSLWFVLATTSIWFVKIYNVTQVLRTLVEAGRYPVSVYPFGHRMFFTFVVPVAFLTTVPAETLVGRGSWAWIAASVGLAAALALAARAFFRFALRFYTSASS